MSRWAERKARRVERRFDHARRELKDACYDLEKWSFADRPSQYEDRKKRIHDLIRRYESLGGDALALLPYRRDYLAAEAMPETFERVRPQWDWVTRRRVEGQG